MNMFDNGSSLVKALAVSLGLLCLQSTNAAASTISFQDFNDVVTITGVPIPGNPGDLPAGVVIVQSCPSSTTCTVKITQPTPIFRSGGPYIDWNIIGGTLSGDDLGILADTLSEDPVGSEAVFTFTSDDDVSPFIGIPGASSITSNGLVQTLNTLTFTDFAGNPYLVDVRFQLIENGQVPEPSTILLIALALVAMGLATRRQGGAPRAS